MLVGAFGELVGGVQVNQFYTGTKQQFRLLHKVGAEAPKNYDLSS